MTTERRVLTRGSRRKMYQRNESGTPQEIGLAIACIADTLNDPAHVAHLLDEFFKYFLSDREDADTFKAKFFEHEATKFGLEKGPDYVSGVALCMEVHCSQIPWSASYTVKVDDANTSVQGEVTSTVTLKTEKDGKTSSIALPWTRHADSSHEDVQNIVDGLPRLD